MGSILWMFPVDYNSLQAWISRRNALGNSWIIDCQFFTVYILNVLFVLTKLSKGRFKINEIAWQREPRNLSRMSYLYLFKSYFLENIQVMQKEQNLLFFTCKHDVFEQSFWQIGTNSFGSKAWPEQNMRLFVDFTFIWHVCLFV